MASAAFSLLSKRSCHVEKLKPKSKTIWILEAEMPNGLPNPHENRKMASVAALMGAMLSNFKESASEQTNREIKESMK